MTYSNSDSAQQTVTQHLFRPDLGQEARLGWVSWLVVVLMAFLPRLGMISLGGEHAGGDSIGYLKVATNILDNFCVSLADPSSALCTPHWGGNQLPGYPAFIAAVWGLFGRSIEAVLVAQSLVFGLTVAYLCSVLARAHVVTGAVWLVATALAFSPALIGWSRSVLTECLSITVAIWLLAELIRSWDLRELRPVVVGSALFVGLLVRYDFVLATVPVALCGFMLHPPLEALRRGLIVAMMIVLPLGAWTVRSVLQGLPPTPPFGQTLSGEPLPNGVHSWIGTWMDDQYGFRSSVWALVRWDYRSLRPPPSAYVSMHEQSAVENMLTELRDHYQGRVVPTVIDAKFMDFATSRIRAQPFDRWILLPLRRIASMWLSPYPSMGWPAEIEDNRREAMRHTVEKTKGGILEALRQDTYRVVVKAAVTAHRYALGGVAIVLAFFAWRTKSDFLQYMSALCVGYALVRTLVFSQTLLIETRYLAPSFAWLDVLAALSVYLIWARWRQAKQSRE